MNHRAVEVTVHTADDLLEHLIDPAPPARYPQQSQRVRVRRMADGRWRAALRSEDADEHVGTFDTMPEAVMRGITAARFVAAGIPWRAEL